MQVRTMDPVSLQSITIKKDRSYLSHGQKWLVHDLVYLVASSDPDLAPIGATGSANHQFVSAPGFLTVIHVLVDDGAVRACYLHPDILYIDLPCAPIEEEMYLAVRAVFCQLEIHELLRG